MAGIYIHIPFCKQACHYCDFHFSTTLHNKSDLIKALIREIELRKKYLQGPKIETIYFGGGTPSILSESELDQIFESVYSSYEVNNDAEITLEANPDDLTLHKIKELKKSPFNRLSIGVQSFYDEDLKWMNRAHNQSQSERAIKESQDCGFENITVDLIYGLPNLTDNNWEQNLNKAFAMDVQHISAYCLTIEPRTALADFVKKGKVSNADEEKNANQFLIMTSLMRENDFLQYEISNFCKNEMYSKHNSNYWKGEHYIGIGPSAHSFDGSSRQWNVKNNNRYIKSANENKIDADIEQLTDKQKYNEYILTSLRTIWGVDTERVNEKFGATIHSHFLHELSRYKDSDYIVKKENNITLTDSGKLIADKIASDLFVM
jgi:oxygen-independent coproporphyrinogen-3 oxidase